MQLFLIYSEIQSWVRVNRKQLILARCDWAHLSGAELILQRERWKRSVQCQRMQSLFLSQLNTVVSFSFDMLRSPLLFPFLKYKTQPDFETIFAERQRVSSGSAPTSKAATENGRAEPSHQEGRQIFTGSLGSSRASSSELSPITSPRGKNSHCPLHADKLEVNLLF